MKVRLTLLATSLAAWIVWLVHFLKRFHSYERISSSMVFGLSIAIAGWLARPAWTFLRKRAWLAWVITAVLLILAIVIPHILMRMQVWNRHPDNIQKSLEGPWTQHTHTFDEAWNHIH